MVLTLEKFALLLLLLTLLAWWWHGHGRRERAFALARQHCEKLDIELLDGNVAFRRFERLKDSRGHKRLARVYAFEFTVTGEQRLNGELSLFGKQLARIALDAHPIPQAPVQRLDPGNVINLDSWRREHPKPMPPDVDEG